jgi:hypothetical protein
MSVCHLEVLMIRSEHTIQYNTIFQILWKFPTFSSSVNCSSIIVVVIRTKIFIYFIILHYIRYFFDHRTMRWSTTHQLFKYIHIREKSTLKKKGSWWCDDDELSHFRRVDELSVPLSPHAPTVDCGMEKKNYTGKKTCDPQMTAWERERESVPCVMWSEMNKDVHVITNKTFAVRFLKFISSQPWWGCCFIFIHIDIYQYFISTSLIK